MILTLENEKRSTGSKNKSVDPISLGDMISIPLRDRRRSSFLAWLFDSLSVE